MRQLFVLLTVSLAPVDCRNAVAECETLPVLNFHEYVMNSDISIDNFISKFVIVIEISIFINYCGTSLYHNILRMEKKNK
ncbi:hypothetical protein V1478_006218 [Vespula squamosa]|uniref:Uncharacterized protein n=1 Tax=Vespula squamosa TaxID=30214 RepID=A0ABD2B786_VESSQ